MKTIGVNVKGDFKNLKGFLTNAKNNFDNEALDRYGKLGVEALERNTPKKSGETAKHWFYTIERQGKNASLIFHNDYIKNGINIAVMLYNGHATRSGTWVSGIDYITESLEPIYEAIRNDALKGG